MRGQKASMMPDWLPTFMQLLEILDFYNGLFTAKTYLHYTTSIDPDCNVGQKEQQRNKQTIHSIFYGSVTL